MKKLLSIVLALVMVFGLCTTAFAVEQQATVPEGYIGIYTAEDLNNIRNNLSGKYILMNDIDLSVYENWEPIGTSDSPFTGELDGNGFVIKRLKINKECSETDLYNIGLFGFVRNITFIDLSIINADINASCSKIENVKCRLGILVGYGYGVNISNCVVSGSISAEGFSTTEIGGITGRVGGISWITLCVNYSEINAKVKPEAAAVYSGGISGVSGAVKNQCCNFGNIKIEGNALNSDCVIKAGGIDGYGFEGGRLNNCYSRGSIMIGFSASDTYVGGLSGDSYITKNSYSDTKIVLPDGFDGYAGAVSGSIGQNGYAFIGDLPHIENVYYSETDLPVGYSFCIHPDDLSEDDYSIAYKSFGELSKDEMINQKSFVGFDFEEVWTMEENGYPVLKNQLKIKISENIELQIGEKYLINCLYGSWKTTNESVATINENGEIVAIDAGTASIIIQHNYGFEIEYIVEIPNAVNEPNCILQILITIWNWLKENINKIFM